MLWVAWALVWHMYQVHRSHRNVALWCLSTDQLVAVAESVDWMPFQSYRIARKTPLMICESCKNETYMRKATQWYYYYYYFIRLRLTICRILVVNCRHQTLVHQPQYGWPIFAPADDSAGPTWIIHTALCSWHYNIPGRQVLDCICPSPHWHPYLEWYPTTTSIAWHFSPRSSMPTSHYASLANLKLQFVWWMPTFVDDWWFCDV